MTTTPFDPELVLSGLKDFQRWTVEYVFQRLYIDKPPARRFLVADEVGLGKTLVARGVVAKAIQHLQAERKHRIDIVYICSNADIARQNVTRLNLNVEGLEQFNLPTRITLLPLYLPELNAHGINFISFTPGTSFDLKSRGGTQQERALLYRLLRHAWGWRAKQHEGRLHLLCGQARLENFRKWVDEWTPQGIGSGDDQIDGQLADAFRDRLAAEAAEAHARQEPSLKERFDKIAEQYGRTPDDVDWNAKQQLLGDLRRTLASSCVEALEPDLVILDEFQRFRHLLDGQDPAADLAQHLFEQASARMLLLSATPYKMYTLPEEALEQEDHYADFLKVTRFLMDDPAEARKFDDDLRRFRLALQSLGTLDLDVVELRKLRVRVENRLRGVMSRTERLSDTPDRRGMLADRTSHGVDLTKDDLSGYLTMNAMSRLLDSGDALEYWKSAPYLLNFMDDYKLKREFRKKSQHSDSRTHVGGVLSGAKGLLNIADVEEYGWVDPGNARLRGLIEDTLDGDSWRLLWLPPALPYYQLGDPFHDPQHRLFTKRLVFSGWAVVPQVIASLISYEADRRMIHSGGRKWKNTVESRSRIRPLLRFARQQRSRRRGPDDGGNQDPGGFSGMSAFALIYPSPALARLADPLKLAGRLRVAGGEPSLEDVAALAERRIRQELQSVIPKRMSSDGPADERWYWVAPLILDAKDPGIENRAWLGRGSDPWFGRSAAGAAVDDAGELGESDGSLLGEVVAHALEIASDPARLGRPPDDLSWVLTRLALASPAVCALRSLARVAGSIDGVVEHQLRDGAARISWGFRSLFNIPEVTAMLRGPKRDEDAYWQRTLDYCMAGCLQAVLDEYLHVLVESEGIVQPNTDDPVSLSDHVAAVGGRVAEAAYGALTVRASNYQVEDIRVGKNGLVEPIDTRNLRCRYALRFGAQNTEDAGNVQRASQVRSAFNSPFWPFVLATTSVGQEGLDFHLYCHAVVHWNLPTNPVDLEQREGRVHRYKGHAVRKNVATLQGPAAFKSRGRDPWNAMFAAASHGSRRADSDVVPFWVYIADDGALIERYVPLLPLSREVELLARLKKSVTIYRLVFGQPRQADLLELIGELPEARREEVALAIRMDLSPKRGSRQMKKTVVLEA